MMAKELTLVIPNYKTFELTALCLHNLQKYTDLARVRVIVIDNDSQDKSLQYLRQVPWIELLERTGLSGVCGPEAHSTALDLALSMADTEYFLVMHTDTIITSPEWLDYLLAQMSDHVAAAGSWKLEVVPWYKQIGKSVEEFFQRCLGKKPMHEFLYLRSHCALYRTKLLKELTRGFFDGDTACKSAHKFLVDAGCQIKFLESKTLMKYLRHLNHATMILNPETGGRKTRKQSSRDRLQRELDSLGYREAVAEAEKLLV